MGQDEQVLKEGNRNQIAGVGFWSSGTGGSAGEMDSSITSENWVFDVVNENWVFAIVSENWALMWPMRIGLLMLPARIGLLMFPMKIGLDVAI